MRIDTRWKMFKRWIGILGVLALLASAQIRASVFGTVKAIVHDPQHRPVQGAQIEVQSRTSSFRQSGATNDDGIPTILNVPGGENKIPVTPPGFFSHKHPPPRPPCHVPH